MQSPAWHQLKDNALQHVVDRTIASVIRECNMASDPRPRLLAAQGALKLSVFRQTEIFSPGAGRLPQR